MEFMFYFFCITTVLSAFRVITHNKAVYALLYFLIFIFSISCMFFLLEANFSGSLEMIIYSNSIVVLFMFAIMILSIDVNDEKKINFYHYLWILSLILVTLLTIIIICSFTGFNISSSIRRKPIFIKDVCVFLFKHYALFVELVSILLFSGLIVSIHFSKNKTNVFLVDSKK